MFQDMSNSKFDIQYKKLGISNFFCHIQFYWISLFYSKHIVRNCSSFGLRGYVIKNAQSLITGNQSWRKAKSKQKENHSGKCSYIFISYISSLYLFYLRNPPKIHFMTFSNGLIKLDRLYDKHIEVMLCESRQKLSTKNIYIQQNPIAIISYIYQKVIVKDSCSYISKKLYLFESSRFNRMLCIL